MYKPTKARRVVCMLLALVMCLSLAPTVSFASSTGAGASTIGSSFGGGSQGSVASAENATLQGVRYSLVKISKDAIGGTIGAGDYETLGILDIVSGSTSDFGLSLCER